MNEPAVQVHLRQIAYSAATLAAIEPGYTVLDNCANPRPDWYEVWPIRQFLLNNALDEAAFYGFFSPKFGSKTGMTHADVAGFVRQHAQQADVLLFSPQPDMGAFYLNVFEQGETFDPGLIKAFEAFLQSIGRPQALATMVMDARQVVFSNYFVARPAFWREWLVLAEAFVAACEGPDTPLRRQLVLPTTYPGQVQRKVFLVERIASLLLATQPRWRTRAADPFRMAWSMTRMRDYPTEAVLSDALKMAYRDHGWGEYLQAFLALRQRCFVSNAPTLTSA
jgi:hypothetical protein